MTLQTKDNLIGTVIVIWAALMLIIAVLNLQSNSRIEKVFNPVV